MFRRVATEMVDELVERLAQAGYDGLTPSIHPVFENIDRDGTRLTELARRARITYQSMGELVDVLETRGYVTRESDPTDGRARLVCLTGRGQQLVRRGLREIAAIEARWLRRFQDAGLSEDLREVLMSALSSSDEESAGRAEGSE